MLNCSNEYPLSEDLYRELAEQQFPEIIAILVIASVICVGMLIMYIESCFFVFKFYRNKQQKLRIMVLLALCPVVAWTSLLVILVPRCTLIGQFVASIYLSFCIVTFLNMLVEFFDGSTRLLEEMSGKYLPFGTPPCCCCCICCNKFPFNKKYLRIVKVLVLQVAIIRPIVMFIATVLWTDDKYKPEQEGVQFSPTFIISVVSSLSALCAVWGLAIAYRSTRDRLPMFRVLLKFASVQLVILCLNVQSFIIYILANNGIPECAGNRGPLLRGSRLNHYLLILEMLLISILARFAFRRQEAENLQQYSLTNAENKNSSDDVNGVDKFADTTTVS